jgi:hypothetical protein
VQAEIDNTDVMLEGIPSGVAFQGAGDGEAGFVEVVQD